MRTTVTINDALLDRVKDRAREQGVTLGEVFESALERFLESPAPRRGLPLPVFTGGGGVHPGIDESSNISLLDAADGETAHAVPSQP